MKPLVFRKATTEDFEKMEEWLYQNNSDFYVNYDEIEEDFKAGRMVVAERPVQDRMDWVGYYTHDTGFIPTFFEIRRDCRRQGIGEAMFENLTNMALQAGVKEMTMLCNPPEAYTFWSKLGFKALPDSEQDGIGVKARAVILPEFNFAAPTKQSPPVKEIKFTP